MRNLTFRAINTEGLADSIAVQNCYPDMHLNVIISRLIYACLSDFLQEISELKCIYVVKMGFCFRTKYFLKINVLCIFTFTILESLRDGNTSRSTAKVGYQRHTAAIECIPNFS
jgi:hypothetical protein